jgi:hypothetical protein
VIMRVLTQPRQRRGAGQRTGGLAMANPLSHEGEEES